MGNDRSVDDATRIYFDKKFDEKFDGLKELLETKVTHTAEIQKGHAEEIKSNSKEIMDLKIDVGILQKLEKQAIIKESNSPKKIGNIISLIVAIVAAFSGLIYFLVDQLS